IPLESYWSNGTIEPEDLPWELTYVGSWVESPLSAGGADSYHALIGPFNAGEQIVRSIKYVIKWDDGNWDVASNGQIIFYDIYFDYTAGDDDPYIFYLSPPEGAVVDPPVTFTTAGDANIVEYWIDGEMIGSDDSIPFEVTWDPLDGLFGDYQIAARATVSNGNVSYSFLNISLDFEINQMAAPQEVDDGLNLSGSNVIISLYAPGKEYVALKGSWNNEFPHGELMNLSGDTLWWYESTLSSGNYKYQ
ncbi:uncharacterized protein METZ01_LOCUS468738, partial [marine metagenome]